MLLDCFFMLAVWMSRGAGRFCISGLFNGQAGRKPLPVICLSALSSIPCPSCALCCNAGSSFPGFPCQLALLYLTWVVGTDGRLREEGRGHGFPPRHVYPMASTFAPQMLPPWSHSAGPLHRGLAPIRVPSLRPP